MKASNDNPKLLTVSEVASILRVGKSTVYQMIERKMLPTLRVGMGRGTLRVTADDLQHYLDGCKSSAEPTPPRRKPVVKLKHLRY